MPVLSSKACFYSVSKISIYSENTEYSDNINSENAEYSDKISRYRSILLREFFVGPQIIKLSINFLRQGASKKSLSLDTQRNATLIIPLPTHNTKKSISSYCWKHIFHLVK